MQPKQTTGANSPLGSGELSAQTQATVTEIINRLKHKPGALLPILHEVQDTLGYVPQETIPLIAQELNLSRAEVHGTVSFYHYFRNTPPGRHVLYLCRAEACQSRGARALEAHAKKQLGIDFHQTTDDGSFSLEPVYCLGNCACAPSLMIDKELHGRVNADIFDTLIQSLQASS